MIVYVVATISALVTGGLFALAFRVMTGIDHPGVLVAIGIFGTAIQWLALISWYLHHTKKRPPPPEPVEPELGASR